MKLKMIDQENKERIHNIKNDRTYYYRSDNIESITVYHEKHFTNKFDDFDKMTNSLHT